MIYSCAGPAYPRWVTDWPPLATALLTAAERSGAVLATASNLYGYGPVGSARARCAARTTSAPVR